MRYKQLSHKKERELSGFHVYVDFSEDKNVCTICNMYWHFG